MSLFKFILQFLVASRSDSSHPSYPQRRWDIGTTQQTNALSLAFLQGM